MTALRGPTVWHNGSAIMPQSGKLPLLYLMRYLWVQHLESALHGDWGDCERAELAEKQ